MALSPALAEFCLAEQWHPVQRNGPIPDLDLSQAALTQVAADLAVTAVKQKQNVRDESSIPGVGRNDVRSSDVDLASAARNNV